VVPGLVYLCHLLMRLVEQVYANVLEIYCDNMFCECQFHELCSVNVNSMNLHHVHPDNEIIMGLIAILNKAHIRPETR
jgi:hypothetical protein